MKMLNLIVGAVLILLVLASFAAAASYTYRIFTGHGTWTVERLLPTPAGPKTAPVIPQDPFTLYGTNPADDYKNGADNREPLPWGLVYSQDNAYWLGWYSNADDSGSTGSYKYVSPLFNMFGNISRATIWLAADDIVDSVKLFKPANSTYYPMGVNYSYLDSLGRFDITQAFRACGTGTYRLVIYVNDSSTPHTCLFAYCSYDWGDQDSISYTYTIGWNTLSIPLYPSTSGATLYSLFPACHPDSAFTFNPATGALTQPLSITAPLSGASAGAAADSVRHFSIRLHFPTKPASSQIIRGYPIREQRYLDNKNSLNLWNGTVDSAGVYIGTGLGAVDYPDTTVVADSIWHYPTGTRPSTRVDRFLGYNTHPRATIPHATPWSWDIKLNSGVFIASLPVLHGPWSLAADSTYPVNDPPGMLEYMAAELANTVPRDTVPFAEHPKMDILPVATIGALTISSSPNPSHSTISITVAVPQTGEPLNVVVEDIEGRLVRSLYNDVPGTQEIEMIWDGRTETGEIAAAGVYILSATVAGKTVQIQNVMIR